MRPRINNGGNHGHNDPSPREVFNEANFKSEWITVGADKDLPSFADRLGQYMAKNGLTKSKIRSIYCEIKRIQMGTYEKENSSFFLLKPKVAYALGRDSDNKGLELFSIAFNEMYYYVKDQKTFNNFCNLIEAILAYHKANGGRE